MTTTVGIKLDEQTRARLNDLGAKKDRAAHWLMKRAILDYLDREERYEQEKQEDEARWQVYQETGAHINHQDMTAWLGELADQAKQRSE